MIKQKLIYTLILMLSMHLFAMKPGTGTISGFVFDKSNKETIIGANVYFENLAMGSSANLSGYFVIHNIPPGEYKLICEYIGYEPEVKTIRVTAGEMQRISLFLEQELLISEVIVVEADSIRTSERLFRQPISKVELTPVQIKKIPQVAEVDLLRSLQTLPGIVPVSDFSSALYVRGGTPDQNLYMIDGADVYNPDHAFGLFSTFNTDAIKHVDMSKGGFGAEYGGRLSSVMDVTYLDGNREEFEGSISLSLLSAKTNLQMPVGNKGSVSGSFRRTYFDKTARQFMDDIPDYFFYDMNLKGYYDIDPNNKLTFSMFGGRDYLKLRFNEDSDNDAGFDYDWGNTTASLRWTHVFSPQLFSNFWATRSVFSSDFGFKGGFDLTEINKITDYTGKGYMEYAHSKSLFTQLGFEVKSIEGRYKQTFPGGRADVHQYRTHYVGFVSGNWKPNWRWDIQTGLRYNYFDSDRDYQDWAPRFSAKYRLTETTNLKFASGYYHQYLHRVPRGFLASIWTTSDQYQKGSSSMHTILGMQKELGENFSLESEVYYKNYNDIYAFNQNLNVDITPKAYDEKGGTIYNDTQGLFVRGDGNSMGFEILLKKDSGPLTGWLGYSLAGTEHTFDGINQEESYPPRHDRTSTVNLVANVDIKNLVRSLRGDRQIQGGSRWMFGANFVYASGQPITVPSSAYFTSSTPDAGELFSGSARGSQTFALYPTTINDYRLPPYLRLDMSVTYEKYFETWSISPYVQVFNVLNRKNIWFIQYNDESTADRIVQDVEEMQMLPVLPTFGLNIKF